MRPYLSFHLSNDQSELLEVSIQNLLSSLAYGALFAFLVLLLFFREWKAPILIATAVPVALILALFGFSLFGITLNTVSLAGLILGVGLMVDNSIIVIDNIRQYRRRGLSPSESGIEGTQEVIRPLISSALTTCSVFLPLIFLSGLSGALFYDQAISVSLALASSLLVAWLVLPTLSRIIDRKALPARENVLGGTRFVQTVNGVLRYRWATQAAFGLFVAVGLWVGKNLPTTRFPALSRQGIEVRMDWNEPLNLEENERRYKLIYQAFASKIENASGFPGRQQFLLNANREGEYTQTVFLISPQNWEDLLEEVPAFIQSHWPRAQLTEQPLRNVFDQVFGQEEPPLTIHLKSMTHELTPAPDAVQPLLDELAKKGFRFQIPVEQFQYQLEIDREAALRHQVSVSSIRSRLRSLFQQEEIGQLSYQANAIPVVFESPQNGVRTALDQVLIPNLEGDFLPLSEFAQLYPNRSFKVITAGRAGPTYDIELEEYVPGIENQVRSILRKTGELSVFFSGQVFVNRQLLRELLWVLGISLTLLYLILAAQFESVRQPFIVLLTVPVGLAAALITLSLAGESINLVSMIGMVVMSGIVVNDAILKVDMINRARQQGLGMIPAIHEGGRRRLRPILMTTLTTILALLPILFSSGLGAELQKPLAWAVIGGLLAGTGASLYLIPVLYQFIASSRIVKK